VSHLIAPLLPAGFWGVDGLAYGQTWFLIPLVLSLLVTFVPPFRRSTSRALSRTMSRLTRSGQPNFAILLAILCGLFLVVSTLWSSAIPLLGDGQLHIRELSGGQWESQPRTDRAPLTFWLMHQVNVLAGSLGTPANVYGWFSQASGFVFIALSALMSKRFSGERNGQLTIFLVLVTQGYVQLFFGYGENYAILFPMVLLYLGLCQGTMEGRTPVWIPAVVLGVTVAMHFVTLALAPALVWSTLKRPEQEARGRVISLASLGMILVGMSLSLEAIGLPFDMFLRSEPGSHTLPWSGPVLYHHPHLFVSWDHLVEALNHYALVAPGFVVGGLLIRKSVVHDATDALLLSAAGPLVLFTLLFNPEIGAFRDWDAFALPALPMALLAGRWINRSFRDDTARWEALLVVGVVSLAHTIGWVGLSADATASEARFLHLLRHAGNSQHARAYGAGSLAGYYRESGRLEDSLQAFEEASEHDPGNGRYHVARAHVLKLQGDLKAAEAALERAISLTPDRLEATINLGKLYLETGRVNDAKSILSRAVRQNVDSEPALHTLGTAYYRLGDFEGAERLFSRAVSVRQDNPQNHIDLGNTFLRLGKYNRAELSLEAALNIDPGSVRARMTLGAVFFEQEEFEIASGYSGR
jgi:tetratricopeptide (TPR) repeat protein